MDSLRDWIQLPNLIDLAVVITLLWIAISWLYTSRARLALMGVAALAGLFALAQEFSLELTTLLLQGFFAFFALMLVVVFQDDLRRLFEGIALWGLRRDKPRPAADSMRLLVRTCYVLAQNRIGALIVLRRIAELDGVRIWQHRIPVFGWEVVGFDEALYALDD